MKPSHTAIGIVVLLLSACFFAGIQGISGESGYAGLSPRFVPTLVGVGLAICGALLTWQGVRGGFRAMPEEDAEEYNEFNFWRASALPKKVEVEESFNEFNYWKLPEPTLEQLEMQAPLSPSKAPAHLR